MKKILLLLFCFLSLHIFVFAQSSKYTTHVIEQGETLSAIATKYHSTVGDIMRLNGMNSKSVLKIGSKIKIPATGKPEPVVVLKPASVVTVSVNSGETTHIVQAHETQYGISKKYGITVDQLRQWNNLPDANLEVGQQLVVSSAGAAGKKDMVQKNDAARDKKIQQ